MNETCNIKLGFDLRFYVESLFCSFELRINFYFKYVQKFKIHTITGYTIFMKYFKHKKKTYEIFIATINMNERINSLKNKFKSFCVCKYFLYLCY